MSAPSKKARIDDSVETAAWVPPASIDDLFASLAGNKFAAGNRPTAGARSDTEVPKGSEPFQLYSTATPNGKKVGILLEELGIPYDAWYTSITKLRQFDKGFVDINPNSKIPCAVDYDTKSGKPVRLFESGSIMLYLAEKYNRFLPKDPDLKVECMNWVFWQMAGQGPMAGNFGHFMVYAPEDKCEARNYGVGRYGMETQRLCSVLNLHLEGKDFIVGGEYTIADMICFPWFDQLRNGYKHSSGIAASDFLNINQYKNLSRWGDMLLSRPAVQRGMQVCSKGQGKPWLTKL